MFEPGGTGRAILEEVARLVAVDRHTLDDAELLAWTVAWDRVTSMAKAQTYTGLAELTRRTVPTGDLDTWELTATEFAAAVPMATGTARSMVDDAVCLTRDLPGTFAALAAGVIDDARARVLIGQLGDLPASERARLEPDLLADAPGLTPGQLRGKAEKARLGDDAAAARKRNQEKTKDRCVGSRPCADGMGTLFGYLPADVLARMNTALDGLADAIRDQRRAQGAEIGTHDQRRADAFGLVFADQLDHGTLPTRQTRQGRRDHLVIIASAATLSGASDAPGDLVGWGPIPAPMARDLAQDAGTVQTAWTDPETGRVFWVSPRRPHPSETPAAAPSQAQMPCTDPATGRCRKEGTPTRYEPTQAQRDHVVARDRRCREPHCRRPASQSDLDHLIPHGQGGPTCECNLIVLCRGHHRLKTHGGWAIQPFDPRLRAAGPLRWVTRLGQVIDEDDPDP